MTAPVDADVALKVAVKDLAADLLAIKKALSHMESLVGVRNGYVVGPPSARLGWTFFRLSFRRDFQHGIEGRFSSMLARYRERDSSQRFASFVLDYLNSRGCNVQIKAD